MGKTRDYGNGITSGPHGNLRIGNKSYTDYGYEDLQKYYNFLSNWKHGPGPKAGQSSTHARKDAEKIKARMEELKPAYLQEQYQAQMAEYQAMMGEYMGAMSEAMATEEPAQEPLKEAQEDMSAARADTARKQLLRKGLMSTMTRYGAKGGVGTKLGA